MWPKALTQLVELAPHVTRLLPLADRYFRDKSASDTATRQALDTHRASLEAKIDIHRAALTDLGDRLHADLGALSSAQITQTTTLSRQIADLEKHLSSTRADALAAKQATEAFAGHLARIEATQRRTQTLAIAALTLLTAILILIATLFLRAH